MAGTQDLQHAVVHSLERAGTFARAVLNAGQLTDGDALLALKVNGADLSLDHGYPARVIIPACPASTTPSGSRASSSTGR